MQAEHDFPSVIPFLLCGPYRNGRVCVRCALCSRTSLVDIHRILWIECIWNACVHIHYALYTHCTLFAMDCQYQFRTTSLHSVNALFIHTPIESGFFNNEVIYFILDENFHVSIQNFDIFSHGVRYVCQSVSCSELIVFRWIELFNRKVDVSLANSIWPNIHIEFVSFFFLHSVSKCNETRCTLHRLSDTRTTNIYFYI